MSTLSIPDLYLAACTLHEGGFVDKINVEVWNQADELRLALGKPFPHQIFDEERVLFGKVRTNRWVFCIRELCGIRTATLACAEMAESVLHVYEAAFPDSAGPRGAIAAARAYALGEVSFDEAHKATLFPLPVNYWENRNRCKLEFEALRAATGAVTCETAGGVYEFPHFGEIARRHIKNHFEAQGGRIDG